MGVSTPSPCKAWRDLWSCLSSVWGCDC